ncbi:MAG: hypothetical protein ACE5J1_02845, partial [Nitrospiria bacterium]
MTRDRFFSILFALYLFSSSLVPAAAENIVPPEDDASERGIIVLDNTTAITSGDWLLNADRHGLEYLWTPTQSAGDRSAFWQLTLPEEGIYAVEAWWRQGTNRSDAAKFIIGTSKERRTVMVNQQIHGDQWNLLGNFSFQADSPLFIGLINKASPGYVVILDKVRLRRLDPAVAENIVPPKAISPNGRVGGTTQQAPKEKGVTVFDPDAPPETRTTLTPLLNVGGKIKLEYTLEKNFDLNDAQDDDLSVLEPELSLAFSFNPSEQF